VTLISIPCNVQPWFGKESDNLWLSKQFLLDIAGLKQASAEHEACEPEWEHAYL